MQCNNSTWQKALKKLMGDADVVVMDLSNFKLENEGVKYELGQLFEQFELNRIIFLINKDTDLKALEYTMNKAWTERSNSSPNKDEQTEIKLYMSAVIPPRKADESIYNWQKRALASIDSEQLVCMLYDVAVPPRKSSLQIEPKRDRKYIYWTQLATWRSFGWIINIVFFTTILCFFFYLIANNRSNELSNWLEQIL